MPIEWRWRGGILPDLIERLNANGFKLTTSETLDATRLLVKLGQSGLDELNSEQLKQYLKPILCKASDPESQDRFDQAFAEWANSPPTARTEWHESGTISKAAATPSSKSLQRPKISLKTGLVTFGLMLAITSSWLVFNQQTVQEIGSDSTHIVAKVTTKPLEPSAPKTHPSKRIYGYWPAYRYYEAVKPEIAWLLFGLPFSILAFVQLPAMVLSRRRNHGGQAIWLDGWGRDKKAENLVPPLPEIVAGQFARHFRGFAKEKKLLARRPRIDVRRTVEATLSKLGIPQLHYRHAQLRPSYLVLVEAEDDDALPILWAERLKHLGIDTDIRRFKLPKQGEIPTCQTIGTASSSAVSFTNLPKPAAGQRLILVSDGGSLLDTDGNWKTWALAAKLERWPNRAVFSPREPRDMLSGRLAKLDSPVRSGDPGFLVLPQEESALAAWSTWLATGRFPAIVLAEAQRFPRLIEEHGEQRYLNAADQLDPHARPDAQEINRLISELNIYLGENGFYWLCCCAVPPRMDSRLTLLLGEEYLRRSGVNSETKLRYHLQRNYRLMARLPWLRHNHIPDWLRLAFLARLTPELQQEIRTVVEGLLARQKPNQRGNLALAFGLPEPGANASKADQKANDTLYVGYMSGLTAQELTLRMPGEWRRWLSSLHSGDTRKNRMKAWLSAITARLLFQNGLPAFGMATSNLKVTAAIVMLFIGLCWSVAYFPSPTWPSTLRHWVFSDQAKRLTIDNQSSVLSIAFSPDGKRIVTGGEDETIRLWDALTGLPIGKPFNGHEGVVNSVAFSPDGKLIASGSDDFTVRLWNAETGQTLGEPLRGHQDIVSSVAFSPDGKRVVSGSWDKTLRLWDTLTGKALGEPILGHNGYVSSVAFSPDGKRIVSGSQDKTVRLWDSETGDQLIPSSSDRGISQGKFEISFIGHSDIIKSVAFSPDGKQIVSGSADNTVRLWDAVTGLTIGQPLTGHTDIVSSVAFSPDGKLVLSGSWDQALRLWDFKTGKSFSKPLTGHQDIVKSVAFSPDGTSIISGSRNNTILIWRSTIGEAIEPPLNGHENPVYSAAYSPDGNRIVSGSNDNTLRLWDADTNQPISQPLAGHQNVIESVAFSPDGKRIVSGSDDNTLRLWDANTGTPIGQPMVGHTGWIYSVAYSPDGKRILSGSNDDSMRLWDADTRLPIGKPLNGHGGSVTGVAYNPQGNLIVSSSTDKTLRLWDAVSGKSIGKPLTGHTDGVWSVAFSPDGKHIVSGGVDKTLRFWDANTGKPIGKPLIGHEGDIYALAFSLDGKRIVSGGWQDESLRLWDTDTGEFIGLINAPGNIRSVDFNPQGDRVVFSGVGTTTSKKDMLLQWRIPPYPAAPPDTNPENWSAPIFLVGPILLVLLILPLYFAYSTKRLRQTMAHYIQPGMGR